MSSGHPQAAVGKRETALPGRSRSRRLDPRFLLGLLAAFGILAVGVAGSSLGSAGHPGSHWTGSHPSRTRIPVAARGPVSAALGAHDQSYRVVALRARNPAQRLRATFGRAGVSVASRSAHVRLRLAGFGYASALHTVASVAPRVAANRVDYFRGGGVDEWYVNGPLGLEQGFEVGARPATGRGPLSLALSLASNLRARLDRSGVVLHGAGGSLRYGGLSASDARGRTLRSWLELRHGRVLIRVDDRGAVYPVRIDPFIQRAELTASDGAAGDDFGASLAISGDTIVATPLGHTVGGQPSQNPVYVFVRPASGWANATQTAELTASDGAAGDGVVGPVAISGDTIVAGAPLHQVGATTGQGAVYVWVKPAGGWTDATQTAELTATDGATNEGLGDAVAVSGDTVVAGASGHKVGTHDQQGAAYVFVKPASGWKNATQSAELTSSDGATRDFLGSSVSISGDTLVVGAAHKQIGPNADQGAAYVFVEPASGWADMTESAELTASDGAASDLFGFAVSISGDTVVIGSPFHQVGQSKQGSAYVFVKPLFGWPLTPHATQTAELTASDGATNDRFGIAVGVSGNTAIVGSFLHQVGANAAQGAAYLFTKPGATWTDTTQTDELTAPDGAAGDVLGDTVAISGGIVVAGAPFHAVGTKKGQGVVYLFGTAPVITIGTPAGGTAFTQGDAVAASYSCTAPAGATITSCAGPVANGAAIDTTTLGQRSFTVNATDSDGLTATQTVTYTVKPASIKNAPKPSITALHQSASVWRERGKRPRTASIRNRPIGTTFSFTLNEPARVTLSFTRQLAGRKVHGQCVNRSPSNKPNHRCTRTIAAGTLTLPARQGANRIRFQGRVSLTKKLAPGNYKLKLSATDTAGRSTSAQPLSFTIVQ